MKGSIKNCQVEHLETPIKSESDEKEYRAIRLPNGLEALLISDVYLTTSFSQEKKAACSLFVDVGYFSDTSEFPNTSFFLGNMLFQEFEKCFEESSTTMKNFIENHDGTYYIEVGPEHTIFYFDIEESNFFSALFNFSLFFVEPIIPKHVFKQIVIKNEFQILFGKSRYEQLLSSFAQIGHPINKFSVDHLIKLRNNIDYDKLYDVLDKFKQRHYCGHRMKLAIQSKFGLKTMEKFVTFFADVPNNRMPPDNFSKFKNNRPFDTPAFRKMYKIKFYDGHLITLRITWALPSFSDFYKCNSYQYIPWIIGYKGEGSLISYLRQKMWSPIKCEHLSDNHIINCKSQQNSLYNLIQLNIVLTSEGRKHLEDVLDAIFSFINLLKRAGPQKEIYNDIYECKQNTFRFTDHDKKPISFVNQLCKNMHFYPPNAYLTGNQFDSNYNAKVIQKCLNYLVPEMANIMILSENFNDFELKKVEPCWQMAYTDIEIPKEWIEHWKVIEPLPEFFLPSPNIFLTNNHFLMPISNKAISKYPIRLYCNSMSEIWYHQDPKFCSPKCCMHFYFISPLKLESLQNGVLMNMYCTLLKQLLIEKLYPAELTGFEYITRLLMNGFTLKISGLSETLPDITLKDFQDFVKSFTEHLYIQCLVQGNMMPSAAIETVQQFIKTINCSALHSNTIQQLRGTQIPLGISYYKIKNITKLDTTSVIRNYYQAGVTTIELSTLIYLLSYIMNDKLYKASPVYKFNRAAVDVVESNGTLGYSITVYTQAHKYTTEYADKKIEEFLRWFKNDLKELTEKKLDVYKETFLKSRSHDDGDIEDERYWFQILYHTYIFNLHEQEIVALKNINVKKLREWFADHTSDGNNFRKLSLHIVGTIPSKEKCVNLEYINDDHQQRKPNKYHYITKVEDYKKKLFTFPIKYSNKSSQR
ncbi:PREDICTED: nardilysin-like [Trachymyrmex septentrionalis]|uniref:nardilysin-like n=1 Tax=Trachymyrmex septentrionalis TaxID=34720 RepID=UPI00084F41AA|nr:PREDICTED: nardilysin-like [Trachymyrmex septentrionalis]